MVAEMAQGPPVPTFIFRGHASSIHALHFFASNRLLASGDSDGWIVIWSVSTKRPIAVWKGHEGGIMGLKDWGDERLISHGRDHHVRVWQLRASDDESLSIRLPVDGAAASESKWPWLLFSMPANALNYCAFSICEATGEDEITETAQVDSRLIASPNGLDAGGIDIFHLPSGRRVSQIRGDKEVSTGMAMAVSLLFDQQTKRLVLVSGYEGGHVMVHTRSDLSSKGWKWVRMLCSQPHTQPVLAIDIAPDGRQFLSSGADAIIARFDISQTTMKGDEVKKMVNTKHAGQQDLKIRDDAKVFATAGWDKRIRVYSMKTLKELAVLKWHQEGCYAVAFANTISATSVPADQVAQSDDVVIRSTTELLQRDRDAKIQSKHWLVAGGKDGKISLWDIY